MFVDDSDGESEDTKTTITTNKPNKDVYHDSSHPESRRVQRIVDRIISSARELCNTELKLAKGQYLQKQQQQQSSQTDGVELHKLKEDIHRSLLLLLLSFLSSFIPSLFDLYYYLTPSIIIITIIITVGRSV